MKKKLIRIVKVTTFFTITSIILQILLVNMIFAAESVKGQELENIAISIDIKEVTLKKALKEIEKKTEYKFVFAEKEIPLNQTTTLRAENESLQNILENLSLQHNLVFKRINNLIVVKKIYEEKKEEEIIIQENKKVSGKVTDARTGEPLIGANIILKDLNTGTTTDNEGNYTISVPENAEILVISFLGYKTREIRIDKSIIDITLEVFAEEIEDVVVIGYGELSKEKVTGAISRVKNSELEKYSSSNFESQLSGKVAGLYVNEFNSQPGNDAQIIIRGTGTLTAGSYPLIVVDNMPLTEGSSLSSINPNVIESIEVLKDAASAAIYGSRAANGVIIITTKKGKPGAPKISLDAYTGWQTRSDKMEYVNAYEAAQYFTEARDWGYVSSDPENRSVNDDRETRIANGASKRELRLNYLDPYLNGEQGLTDTDWLGELFQTAPISNYSLAISGGTPDFDYVISGNYLDQDGIAIETDFRRWSSSVKVNGSFSDRFDVGISINPSYSEQNYLNTGSWNTDILSMSYISYPFFSPYSGDGSLAISTQLNTNEAEDGALVENPVAVAKNVKQIKESFRTFGNVYLSARIIDGLYFKTMFGGDYRNNFYDYYNPSFIGKYRTTAPKAAESSETRVIVTNILSENTLNYFTSIGDHEIDLLGGYTFQSEVVKETEIEGTGIPDDNIQNIAGASSYSVDESRSKWTQISYLSRAQYFYKQRYQISFSVRADGSSRFGDDSKWAVFPSVSAGWIFSDEPFFPKSKVVTFAKLRASWGQTGNNQIGAYSSKALVTSDEYVFGEELNSGYSPSSSPNPSLSWESNSSTNLGIDLEFLKKITFTMNYYYSITKDLLLDVPVPEQSGYSESLQNIGEVQNTGFEFQLAASGLDVGPVKWDFSGNLTTNSNEVLALAPDQTEISTGKDGAFRTIIGGPIAEIYGYNIIGVYKTEEQIDNSPHLSGTLTGDYIVEDLNNDGVIDNNDKKGFGTYEPDFIYSFSSSFTYDAFQLSFSFQGVVGRTIYDYDQAYITEVGEGFGVPSKYYFDNRYHPENNPDGFFAQPNMGNFSSARKNTRASSIHFQDGSYLRLRNICLSYDLPKELINPFGLSSFRIYVSANNLFTITDYRGFNPEATSTTILTAGYGRSNYPLAKSYILGFNIKL
ncbi:MAG: TonB-dependent receptor [Ignavibacteria bacterium]|jgi:TonB-linked SusC/RagA family outer membrane protein